MSIAILLICDSQPRNGNREIPLHIGGRTKERATMRSIVLGIGLALALAAPAFSQTNSTNQNSSSSSTGSISAQDQSQNQPAKARQQVQQNLSKAGYTDIKIMPESFLVRAKDPSGNPIMMIINPDSVAAITFGPRNTSNANGSANSTSGSRSNR